MTNTEPRWRQQLNVIFLASALAFLPWSKMYCHASLILYVALWFTEGRWKRKFDIFKKDLVLVTLTAWFFFLTIKTLSGGSMFGLEKNVFLFLVPVCVATSTVALSQQHLRSMLYVFSASCFVMLLYCYAHSFYQWDLFNNNQITFQQIDFLNSSNYFENNPHVSKTWVFFTYIGLAGGANIHPSYLSLYIGFVVVFLLIEGSREQTFPHQRTMNTVAIVFFLIALVLLSSRIILFSVTAVLIAIVAYDLQTRRSRKQIMFAVLVLVGVILGVFLNPISRHRNWNELTSMSYTVKNDTNYRTSSEIRASLWWLGWKSFQSVNPFWGVSDGNVEKVMKTQGERYSITNVLGTYDPHNQFLYTIISNGLIGVSLLAAVLISGFVIAARQKQIVFLSFLFLFTALCLTESALELQKGIVFFSILFSLFIHTKITETIPSPTLTSFAGVRN